MSDTNSQVTIWVGDEASQSSDRLATEEPLEFRIDETPIAVLMRTPGMERELALGFCLTEGILLSADEFAGLEQLDQGRYMINLSDGVTIDAEQFRRNTYTTSSCGVCGKASIDAVLVAAAPLADGPIVAPSLIRALVSELTETQPAFAATGGLHGAAIRTLDGATLGFAEDVGRHNAVDKAIGMAAAARWPLEETILVVSGRTSFEITQKAAVAGIPIVAGVSAASSLAVDLGRDLGMTLIGFVRGNRMVVYCGDDRVRLSTAN